MADVVNMSFNFQFNERGVDFYRSSAIVSIARNVSLEVRWTHAGYFLAYFPLYIIKVS